MVSLASLNQQSISGFAYARYSSSIKSTQIKTNRVSFRVRAAEGEVAMATEKMGIKIENNPPESKLTDLGVKTWPKWGCPPSKFPWTYSDKETCYLLKGKVKVYPDGYNEFVEFGVGDLVEFPKGMSCTWEVSETVDSTISLSSTHPPLPFA